MNNVRGKQIGKHQSEAEDGEFTELIRPINS